MAYYSVVLRNQETLNALLAQRDAMSQEQIVKRIRNMGLSSDDLREFGFSQEAEVPKSTGRKDHATKAPGIEIPKSKGIYLKGHKEQVTALAWHPSLDLLGGVSTDGTGSIWDLSHQKPERKVLMHGPINGEPLKVIRMDWNPDGTLMATGCWDGSVKIWNTHGALIRTTAIHDNAITALQWNKSGDFILTGSFDCRTVVTDGATGDFVQMFQFHRNPIMSVAWQTSDTFASCGMDLIIHIVRLGDNLPIKTFSGHTAYIHMISWCPQSELLASCSVDKTIKIWSLKTDRRCYDFKAHDYRVYGVHWSPTGPGTNNPNANLMLASASTDMTVRLWNIDNGRCIRTLTGHTHGVYAVAFSPDSKLVASGSLDRSLKIWCAHTGQLVHSYKGPSYIFRVCWNSNGTKVVACTDNGKVFALDLRNLSNND